MDWVDPRVDAAIGIPPPEFSTLLLLSGKFTCTPSSPAAPVSSGFGGQGGYQTAGRRERIQKREEKAQQAWGRGRRRNEEGQMRQTGEAEEATLMLLSSHRPSVSRCSSEQLAPPPHHHPPNPRPTRSDSTVPKASQPDSHVSKQSFRAALSWAQEN